MRARALRSAMLALGVAAVSTPSLAQPDNTAHARSLAATCANCHGPGGVSQGTVVSLAGMPQADLVRALQEFKSGARPGTVMPQLAKGYNDAQIAAIAAWFASRKPN